MVTNHQYEIRFTLHERRKSSTIVECIRQMNFFMQNEPNFQNAQMNISSLIRRITNYEQRTINSKNEPKTNPKRTQYEPKRSQFQGLVFLFLGFVCLCYNPGMIEIGKGKNISEKELFFTASRSSGPGGQNVNKVNTRITLFFDVPRCENLSDSEKNRILKRLATRADKKGVIRIASQKYRTQKANRNAAVDKLQQLLADALQKRKVRKKTKVPYAERKKRLEEKKQRSRLKQQRDKRIWKKGADD